jgi:hypothetical protein
MNNTGRVTAGLPSLTPGLRGAIFRSRLQREMSRQRLLDHIGRESSTTAPDGAIDTTSPEAQLGIPLSVAEMQKRLLLCNSNFHFEISLHDSTKMGIYILENRDGVTSKRFLCGMMNSVMPERSIRVPKQKSVPSPKYGEDGAWQTIGVIDVEIRGWRTVLAMLLRSKLITQAQIEKFWPLSSGQSKNWQKLTT